MRKMKFVLLPALIGIVLSFSANDLDKFSPLHKGIPAVRVRVLSHDPVVAFAAEEWVRFVAAVNSAPDYGGNFGYYTLNLGIAGNRTSTVADQAMEKHGMTREKLGEEGFLVAGNGKREIVVAAYSGKGVLNGVYKVLEKTLGAVAPRPAAGLEFPEAVRQSRELPLPYSEKPAFALRGLSLSREYWKVPPIESMDWMARNLLNHKANSVASYPYTSSAYAPRGFKCQNSGHAFLFWIPPQEYGKSNPEYFPLIDGKRTPKAKGAQLAFGNPEVIQLLIRKITDYKKQYPEIEVVAFGTNDSDAKGMGFGDDPLCLKLDEPADIPPKDSKRPRFYTTRYIKAANQVASGLSEQYPDLKLHIYAYNWNGGTIAPPNCDVHPNLLVEFAPLYRCYQHPLNDPNCPRNVMFADWLRGWAARTSNIYVRDYYLTMTDRFSLVSLEVLKRDIAFYRELNLIGLVPETAPDGPDGANAPSEAYPRWVLPPEQYARYWDSNALLHFAMARLLWNPDEKLDDIIDLFCRNYYGSETAKDMAQWHKALNRNMYLSGRPGEAPPADKNLNYYGWIDAGLWCNCWNWRPRLLPAVNRMFNVRTKGDFLKNAQAPLQSLVKAVGTAGKLEKRRIVERVDRDRQMAFEYLLTMGYELDWRLSTPEKLIYSQTPERQNIQE